MGFSSWPPFWRIMTIVHLSLWFLYFYSTTVHYYVTIVGSLFAIPHLSWLISRLIKHKVLQRTYISPAKRCVLISGCDSGFGNLVARKLDAYGFYVFAGCLFPDGEGAVGLEKQSKNLRVVKLDVTRREDVERVVEDIKGSGYELWGIVNNAGVAEYVPAEWGDDVREYEKMFAVNVFGLVRATKACLPLLRKSKGRVVNLGSMTGRITFGGITQYCMSKSAVRTFSDGLRREMYSFGVKVVCIEPMMYSTNIMNTERMFASLETAFSESSESVQSDYGLDFKDTFKRRLVNSVKTSRPQIHEVVDAIEEAITNEDPEIYYKCCGPRERPALWTLEQVSGLSQDFVLTGKTWATLLRWFNAKI